jgi:tetratricopeptide (TPR) repeat protein
VTLAEEAEPQVSGPEQGAWLARLEAEHDNLRAALGWARERAEGEVGLRLAGALWRFWYMRGFFSEGRTWLEAALFQGHAAAAPETVRAQALYGAGALALSQGDCAQARAVIEESLALWRELGDRQGIATTLRAVGHQVIAQGDFARAQSLYEESLVLFRELDDRHGIAVVLSNLGGVAESQMDYRRAQAQYEESLVLLRESGDKQSISIVLNCLGGLAWRQGDYARARNLCHEGLALARALGDRQYIAGSLVGLGMVAADQGDYVGARTLLEEGLASFRELGDRWGILGTLEGMALLAGAQDQARRGARLWGAADALRQAIGTPRPPSDQARYDEAVQAMRSTLSEEGFSAAWAEGRTLPPEEAIALAMDSVPAE